MDSLIQMSNNETATSVWTEEKHVHFLNTMEDSFVRTMLHRYQHLRLDRHIPDTSESTLDSKPAPPNRKPKTKNKKLAPSSSSSDSTGPRARTRRTRRRSSQPSNSSQQQVAPQLENEREGDACVVGENYEHRRNV